MKKIILLLIICILIMSIFTFAYDPNNITISQTTEFNSVGNKIIGSMQLVGAIVAVAALAYIGIRFMLASPGERADLKKILIPYVIGALILFTASIIVGIVQSII